jgi:hypothetical protein
MGFQANEPNVTLTRRLDLYPTVFFGIGEGWSIALYPENPIQHNDRSNKWFVPIDSMLVKRFNKTVEAGMGISVGIVKDSPAYG